MEKSAGIALEFKDLDTNKRTAIIKHAVYNSIDRTGDISHKGMFTKSWNEGLPDFRFNHNKEKRPGKVLKVFEDNEGAYTQVKFANTTVGNDVLEMASEDMLSGASFGYVADKKDFASIKGKRIRNLREVYHEETSLLDILPAHPEAGIVVLNKSFSELELKQLTDPEQSLLKTMLLNDQANLQSLMSLVGKLQPNDDLYTWIMYQISRRADSMSDIMSQLKYNTQQVKSISDHVAKVEDFCRKSKASDETIIALQQSIVEYKQIISDYDTAITQLAVEPVVSDDEMQIKLTRIKLLLAS